MGETNLLLPVEVDDDTHEDTPVASHRCGPCVRLAETIALAEASGVEMAVTAMHTPLEQSEQPWTVMIARKGAANIVIGRGATEETALYEALRLAGVVT